MRSLGTRVARLEATAPGSRPRVFVVSGYSEADHETAIADLIAKGEARKHDVFVCLRTYFTDFLATADGLKLVSAFPQIGSAELRRSIVRLVEGIVGESADHL